MQANAIVIEDRKVKECFGLLLVFIFKLLEMMKKHI